MFSQAVTLLLSCLTFALCQVVFKDKVHRFIYEYTPCILLHGSGFEAEAKYIHLELGVIGQELVRDKDYSVENLIGRRGLKINLLTQWVNFTEAISPESLYLKSVTYEGFTTNALSFPVVVATVFRTPTLFPSNQMIDLNGRSKGLRIYGKHLKGLEEVSLAFSGGGSCGDFQQNLVSIVSTMSSPLQDDFLTLEVIPRLNYVNNEMRVYGICAQKQYLRLNGNDGIIIARFHQT